MYTGIMIDQKRERETETEEAHVCSVCYKGRGTGKNGSRSKIMPVVSERFQTPMYTSDKISRSINSAQQISLVILKGSRSLSSPLYASCRSLLDIICMTHKAI